MLALKEVITQAEALFISHNIKYILWKVSEKNIAITQLKCHWYK